MLISVDGSLGEGGGQILRTSLSLSLVTQRAFRIENLRAGREKPGLLRQHLTAVMAAAEISGAEVKGATLGSASVTFSPGKVRAGEYRFAVGTAGSATLIFQTVLPALMLADGPSKVVFEGGTHNHAAPPYHFLAAVFVPLIERMGPKVKLEFGRYGFYPAGGGRFSAEIHPVARLRPLHLGERVEITSRRILAIVANLPLHIAQREVETAGDLLNWEPESRHTEMTKNSAGPGNVTMVEIKTTEAEGSEITEICTAFGQLGVSAEVVGSQAAHEAREYLVSRAAAGEHVADQLLLPIALAASGSFTAVKMNLHARTNLEVIAKFLPVRFAITQHDDFVRVEATPPLR